MTFAAGTTKERSDEQLFRCEKARLLRTPSPGDVRATLHVSRSFSVESGQCSPRTPHRRSLSDSTTFYGSSVAIKTRPRFRSYADQTKPRPLFRGVVHGGGSIALACGIVWMHTRSPVLALAFLCKLCTYACSATFHLYPRGLWTMADETRAFIADIIAVPLSISGTVLPFAGEVLVREVGLAGLVLLVNLVCVAWQTAGQVGLQTPVNKSDLPRTICICFYSIWSAGLTGMATGFSGGWLGMTCFAIVALFFANCVAKAHHREPTAPWARWHFPGVNSFHEDFHLALLGSDLCWLALALSRLSVPA